MVRFVPADQQQFDVYRAELKQRYAESIAHSWEVVLEEAQGFAEVQLTTLLPSGVDTPHHAVCVVLANDKYAGMVWFSHQPGSIAYIYDIYIEPAFRRQGIGSALIREVERQAAVNQCFAISLHVFEGNVAARCLYEKQGLKPVGTQLYKRL